MTDGIVRRRPATAASGPCFYCDDKDGPFVREHFVPRSALRLIRRKLDGLLEAPAIMAKITDGAIGNEVDACVTCDLRKGNLLPLAWLAICPPQGRRRVRAKLERIAVPGVLAGPSTSDGPRPRQPMPPPAWSRHAPAPGKLQSLREHAPMYLAQRDGVTEESRLPVDRDV